MERSEGEDGMTALKRGEGRRCVERSEGGRGWDDCSEGLI